MTYEHENIFDERDVYLVCVCDVGRGDSGHGGDLGDTVGADRAAEESVAEDVDIGDGVAVGEDVEAGSGHTELVVHHDELPGLADNHRLGLK